MAPSAGRRVQPLSSKSGSDQPCGGGGVGVCIANDLPGNAVTPVPFTITGCFNSWCSRQNPTVSRTTVCPTAGALAAAGVSRLR